jgi:dipeptidyl aminopeptidase/acylaminoacyl peptidase
MPVRILQGVLDDAVPWEYAQQIVHKVTSDDVRFHLIKDADHRLSRPQDIALLIKTVMSLCEHIELNPETSE